MRAVVLVVSGLVSSAAQLMGASVCVYSLTSLPNTVAAQTGSVEIWMRAFTPDPDNAGGARASIVKAGVGNSVVKVPVRNEAFDCYATDHRGFSSDPSTTARLETTFSIIPTGHETAIVRSASQRTRAAEITQVDCSTFVSLRKEMGRLERDHMGAPVIAEGAIQVAGQVTSADGQGAPINYRYDVRWRPFPGQVTATVSVRAFPAFEMYARIPGKEWVEVMRNLPTAPPSLTASDTFGVGFIQLSESVALPVLDGTWESDDAERRFLLRIQGTSVSWTERDASGGVLTRQLPVWFGDDAATISRANDVEVLTFLGFQPKMREQILARAPIPSFITLTVDDQGLLAEWFGLLVIKDEHDQLETLVQPGTRAPKRFRLQPQQT